MTAEILSFETGRPAELADGEPALVVDVAGYEGPLDLLLALARTQKVDLSKISILALADQYLQFIEAARKIRLELAADYLVMAAWLAFLKSRLLLPEPPAADGPSAEEMATALANRLRKLEAIREAANRLMNRPQFRRDIFPRGNPEAIAEIRHPRYTATLYDLLTAYAVQRQSRVLASVHLAKRTVWSLSEARASLERLIGAAPEPRARERASGQAHRVVAVRSARLAGAVDRHGRYRALGLSRRVSAPLCRRSLAARHGVRVELCRSPRTGA
jgi:segregation and condensation protein A